MITTNSGSAGVGVCRRVCPRSRLARACITVTKAPQHVQGGVRGVVRKRAEQRCPGAELHAAFRVDGA